ncbi:hypothetical protein, partial (plasmid) [Salmonella enterica subsp. enterica serovar Typhi str. CT18]
MAVTLAGLE